MKTKRNKIEKGDTMIYEEQEFRLKDDELAQFDEFLNNPKHTCFHGKEYLIYKDPDPEGSFIIVGVNFRILPVGTPIVTKDGSVI